MTEYACSAGHVYTEAEAQGLGMRCRIDGRRLRALKDPPATVGAARERASARGAQHVSTRGKVVRLDARPDTVDFRDRVFQPTLTEVPPTRGLSAWRAQGVPVLDQGKEGACTGFALATVVNALLRSPPQKERPWGAVSPHMLYAMARRYDEWPGEGYEGSSARGAMKGFCKHGVCRDELWPAPGVPAVEARELALDALSRPLGAYLRVPTRDLVAMHCALAEVGVLLVTLKVHAGWFAETDEGRVRWAGEPGTLGGHAIALVGYDDHGFWFQNSWGMDWGTRGCGHLSYADWLKNSTDAWVARLGVPLAPFDAPVGAASTRGRTTVELRAQLDPHVVLVGNDGRPRNQGEFATTAAGIHARVSGALDEMGRRGWGARRIVVYAHGGLVGERAAIEGASRRVPEWLADEVYPLEVVWRSGALETLENMLEQAFRGRAAEGVLGDALDALIDRIDDTLEVVARPLGRRMWAEMKQNAELASLAPDGALRVLADALVAAKATEPRLEVHVVGHSAGSILLGRFVARLAERAAASGAGSDPVVETATLWAPACTLAFARETWAALLRSGSLGGLTLVNLSAQAELDDDCAGLYHKSLLWLVANAFEGVARRPTDDDGVGTPLLGMTTCLHAAADLRDLRTRSGPGRLVVAGGEESAATSHGAFDNDPRTLAFTLRGIVGGAGAPSEEPVAAVRVKKLASRELISRLGTPRV